MGYEICSRDIEFSVCISFMLPLIRNAICYVSFRHSFMQVVIYSYDLCGFISISLKFDIYSSITTLLIYLIYYPPHSLLGPISIHLLIHACKTSFAIFSIPFILPHVLPVYMSISYVYTQAIPKNSPLNCKM